MPDRNNQYYLRDLYKRGFLDRLLLDRATKKSIVWASDTYSGMGIGRLMAMAPEFLVKRHGEVFTPLAVCERMRDYAHKALQGKDWQKFVSAPVLEITSHEAPFLASRRDQGGVAPIFSDSV